LINWQWAVILDRKIEEVMRCPPAILELSAVSAVEVFGAITGLNYLKK
jgi:hypothetical protein